jgi:L-lactate utilization protein LutB
MIENDWEKRFLERARELLNNAAEDLDRQTRQSLEHIRFKALSGVDEWLERLIKDIQKRG